MWCTESVILGRDPEVWEEFVRWEEGKRIDSMGCGEPGFWWPRWLQCRDGERSGWR